MNKHSTGNSGQICKMQSLVIIDIVPVSKVRAAPTLPLAPLKHLHNLPERAASQVTPGRAWIGLEWIR